MFLVSAVSKVGCYQQFLKRCLYLTGHKNGFVRWCGVDISYKDVCVLNQLPNYFSVCTGHKFSGTGKTTNFHVFHRSFHTTSHEWNQSSGNDKDDPHDKNKKQIRNLLLAMCLSAVTTMLMFRSLVSPAAEKRDQDFTTGAVTWQEFVDQVLPSGEVQKITVVTSRHTAIVYLKPGAMFYGRKAKLLRLSNIKDTSRLEDMLRAAESSLGVDPLQGIQVDTVDSAHLDDLISSVFYLSLIVGAICLALIFSFSRTLSKSGPFTKLFSALDGDVSLVKNTNVRFKDVAGMKEAKQEVMEFVHFLKKPDHYERLGAKMPRGCLLTGPPGVGKTLLAKAVANEANVPFIAKAGSDFVEMIGGLGARRIRKLFEEARNRSPCIIYIDELDALGASRSEESNQRRPSNSEKDQTLNQVLVEMDGMLSKQHQVIVLASTNRPDILDKALLRPGRFDRQIYIDLPNRVEREEILLCHLGNLKLEGEPSDYAHKMATVTPGMSGADLANVCNEAAIYAARQNDPRVNQKHVDYAVERVIAGAPKSVTSVSPEERRVVATHESGHALIGWLLEHTDALAKVTIIPRTKAALGFARTVPSDRRLHTQEQLVDYMCMALGGRAAEDIVFGNVTQGAQDDLRKVTDMAYAQVKYFGFNPAIGPLSFKDDEFLKPYSDGLAETMDREVRVMVKNAYDRAKSILVEHRQKLDQLSHALLNREALSYDDVEELIGPPAFGSKNTISTVPFGPLASEMEERSSDAGKEEKPQNDEAS